MPEIVLARGARSWPPRARRIAVGVVYAAVMAALVVGGVTAPDEQAASRIDVAPLTPEPDARGPSPVDVIVPATAAISDTSAQTTPVIDQTDMPSDESGEVTPDPSPGTPQSARLFKTDPVVGDDPDPEQPPGADDPTAPARAVVVPLVTAAVDSVEALAPAVKPAVDQLRDTARRVQQLLPG